MKSKGIHRTNYLPDCIQQGFMALWLELVEDNTFLAHKDRRQAVFFILARCKISSLSYYDDKYDSLEEIVSYDWHNKWNEHTITSFNSPSSWWNSIERWATWATDVDIPIDVEQIMQKLATKHSDSYKYPVALYYVTTQVTRKDAAKLASLTPWNFYRSSAEPILKEVQYKFAQAFLTKHNFSPPQHKIIVEGGRYKSPYPEWREKHNAGDTAPAEDLLEQYSNTVCVSGAIRAQLEGKTYTIAAWLNERPYIQKIRKVKLPIGKEMVRNVLQNRHYTGRVCYAETLYRGTIGEGKRSSRKRKV